VKLPAALLEFKIDSAVAYTISKGRMPKDVHELREWLREFASYETKLAENILDAYKEHMSVCTRHMIIRKGEL